MKVVERSRLISFLESLGLLSAVYLPRGLTHWQTLRDDSEHVTVRTAEVGQSSVQQSSSPEAGGLEVWKFGGLEVWRFGCCLSVYIASTGASDRTGQGYPVSMHHF